MQLSPSNLRPRTNGHHGQRRREIVESLLGDVFAGRLRPGQRLVTQRLAEQFGVSHTPIREALINLAGMGVIDHVPNRGAVVRRVAAKDVQEICGVRRVLECEAVRCACGRIDQTALSTIAAELPNLVGGNGNSASLVEKARLLDDRLHDLIAGSCGNGFLANELGRLKMLFRAFRDLAWEESVAANDFERLEEEVREHLEIVAALQAGDGRAASKAMSRHVLSGGRYWRRAVERMKT